MSHIVDALVFDSVGDKAAMEEVNAALVLADADRQQQFGRLESDMAGGYKVFGAALWAGAFNHFPGYEIEKAFAGAAWEWPERVVLIVDPYDSDEDPRAGNVLEVRERVAKRDAAVRAAFGAEGK